VAVEKEWQTFLEERSAGAEDIQTLRARVAEEDARKKAEREANALLAATPVGEADTTEDVAIADTPSEPAVASEVPRFASDVSATVGTTASEPAKDESKEKSAPASERKDEPTPMQVDDDDAVEY
jgi:hypothetical protein